MSGLLDACRWFCGKSDRAIFWSVRDDDTQHRDVIYNRLSAHAGNTRKKKSRFESCFLLSCTQTTQFYPLNCTGHVFFLFVCFSRNTQLYIFWTAVSKKKKVSWIFFLSCKICRPFPGGVFSPLRCIVGLNSFGKWSLLKYTERL